MMFTKWLSRYSHLIIVILLAVAAGIGLFLLNYHPASAPQAPTAPPMQFQPEGQMLTEAIQPDVAKAGDDVVAGYTNIASSVPGYAYDPKACGNTTTTPYICFAGYYKALVLKYGVDAAFSDIKTRYTQNQDVAADCHPLMHAIGQAAALLYPDVSTAYLHGDSFCWSGYYHGILEGVALKIGKQNLPSQVNTICAGIPGSSTYNFDYFNCVHGLGHGIMELNDDDVVKSLGICDNLTGSWEQSSCYGGVFMENVINDSIDHDSKFLKTSDLLYPCDMLADKYKDQCYLGQTSYALEHTNYNFSKVSALCATVEEPYRDICFQSYGRDAANQSGHDGVKTKALCMIPSDANDQDNCIVGAAKEIVSYYHSDTQANAFCALLIDPQSTECANTVQSYYANF